MGDGARGPEPPRRAPPALGPDPGTPGPLKNRPETPPQPPLYAAGPAEPQASLRRGAALGPLSADYTAFLGHTSVGF